MYLNVELNKENYGLIRISTVFLLIHKHLLNSSAHNFWDDSKILTKVKMSRCSSSANHGHI